MPGHVATPPRPRLRAVVRSPAPDPRAGEAEKGGKQGDRGDDQDQHDDRDRDPDGGQEGDARDGHAQDRDHDGAAGEDGGLTGGRDGAAGRLLDGHPARQVLPVARDQQQGVVDADAEADHGGQLRRPGRHVDQVRDERHRADAEREAEERHPDREAHGDDRAERHQQDHGRDDEPDQLADPRLGLLEGEEEIAAHLDPEAGARARLGHERLQGVEVCATQLLEHGILEAQQGDPAVGRDRTAASTGAQHVRQGGRCGLDVGQRVPSVGRVAERHGVVARRQHQLRGESGPLGPGGTQQRAGLLRVQARHVEGVLEVPADGSGRSDHEDRDREPGSDRDERPPSREPAEQIQGVRHGIDRRRRPRRTTIGRGGHSCVLLPAEPRAALSADGATRAGPLR